MRLSAVMMMPASNFELKSEDRENMGDNNLYYIYTMYR